MRSAIKLLLFTAVALIIPLLWWGHLQPNGLISTLNWSLPEAPQLTIPLPDQLPSTSEPQATEVHKWQDASGTWHYSNTPPAPSAGAATLRIDPTSNVTPGFSSPPASAPTKASTAPALPIPGLPGPQLGRDLAQQARDVERVQTDRLRQMDQAVLENTR